MVRRDDVDHVGRDCLAQRIPIRRGLDRGVALYLRAERGVIGLVEPQVMDADLDRDSLLADRARREQLELLRRRQVQDVQPRVVTPGQAYRE